MFFRNSPENMVVLNDLIIRYPGRQSQITLLYNLFGFEDEPVPDVVFIHGCSGTGKSTIVIDTLRACNIYCAIVNLIECYTSKILFETILNKLMAHVVDPSRGQPYAKCDNMMEFIFNLQRYAKENDISRSVIILDKAERLRHMDGNLLPGLLRLRELSNLATPFSVIFISELPFQKYYFKGNIVEPLKIFFPQYNMKEFIDILTLDYNNSMKSIRNSYKSLDIDLDFYKNYLHVFLSVFYRNCRDLNELKYMSRLNLCNYCQPIIKGECDASNAMALWKNISPILKSSLDNLYLRISTKSDKAKTNQTVVFSSKNLAHTLELPFYAKYLLIASYLASYNSPKDDKRLFMKYHGRKRKTMKDVKEKSKVSEQLRTNLGPKAFGFNRLIAIFYAILDEKVDFNSSLLAQLSSLVELQLLTASSDGCNLNGQKYKCSVGFDVIQNISAMVEFNIRKYLSDFSHM